MADTTSMTTYERTYALVPASANEDPALIRQQIDHTRAQLETTIEAIGKRLSPETLIEQAKTSAREATVGRINEMKNQANRKVEGVSTSLSQTVRDNPLPVAVIGLGLGWLLLSERNKRDGYRMDEYAYRGGRQRYYDDYEQDRPLEEVREFVSQAATAVENKAATVKHRVKGAIEEAGESVSDVANQAGETVSETTQRVGAKISDSANRMGSAVEDTASRVGETVEAVQQKTGQMTERARMEADRLRHEAEWRSRRTAMRTKQTFWENMEDNPLAVGAVLAIAGAAVGAAIPASEYENKLMGQTRDRLLDEAKVRAQDVVERVQTVVEDTQHAVVSEAKDAARRQNLTIDDMIGEKDNSFNS